MSIWSDPISIPPFSIIIFFLGYFINKYLDAKAGRHLADPIQKVDYITDELVEQAIKQGKKFEGLRKHFQSAPPSPDLLNEMDQLRIDDGLFLSNLQLQMDEFKDEIRECEPEMQMICNARIVKLEKIISEAKNGS